MRLSDLVIHTQSVLPLFTDKFSTTKAITGISKTGNNVTVTASSHGLSGGNQVLLSGIMNAVPITSITFSGQIATCTTSVDNDLTAGFVSKVVIESPEPVFDGTFDLVGFPSSTQFQFRFTGTPAGSSTGTLKTFFSLGLNGVQTVTSVTDSNNFVFENTNAQIVGGDGDNMLMTTDIRISAASNLDILIASFTDSQDEITLDKDFYGYFVFDNMTISKDRSVNTDATQNLLTSNQFKLVAINQFHFYVFVRTSDQLAGRSAIDDCLDLAKPIYKTLLGYKPATQFVSEQEVVVAPIGHQLIDYAGPYLIYDYQFEVIEYIVNNPCAENVSEFMGNYGDSYAAMDTVAFRLFNSQMLNDFDTIVKNDNFQIPSGA